MSAITHDDATMWIGSTLKKINLQFIIRKNNEFRIDSLLLEECNYDFLKNLHECSIISQK